MLENELFKLAIWISYMCCCQKDIILQVKTMFYYEGVYLIEQNLEVDRVWLMSVVVQSFI